MAGCAISALEVASDLAMLGAARVLTTNRKQRYILPSCAPGADRSHRFLSIRRVAAEHFPLDAVAAAFKAFVLRIAGNPEQFGAPRPADNILRPESHCASTICLLWPKAGSRSTPDGGRLGAAGDFADGTEEEVDALICGTGYVYDWDLLDELRAASMRTRSTSIPTSSRFIRTSGLAFVGLFHQVGPILPVLEQQARWVAYAWSGARAMPSESEMRTGVEAYRPGVIFRSWCPCTRPRESLRRGGRRAGRQEWPTSCARCSRAAGANLVPVERTRPACRCEGGFLRILQRSGSFRHCSCCRNSAPSFRCWLPRGAISTSPHSSARSRPGRRKLISRNGSGSVEIPCSPSGDSHAPLQHARYVSSPSLRSRRRVP